VQNHHTSLGVSVVTFNTRQQELLNLLSSLTVALEHLNAAGNHCSVNLTLVDNSEPHLLRQSDFEQFIPRWQPLGVTLKLITGHGNIGFGCGHNLAIRNSDETYHLVLNSDVELAPDALLQGLSYLEEHADVAMVSPATQDASGQKQYLCKRQPSVLKLAARGIFPRWLQARVQRLLHHYEMRDLPEHKASKGIPHAGGCFMLCRGDHLREIGGFDESYFLYFEDFDLCRRLDGHGTIAYLPAMQIRHFGGQSARKGLRHILLFIKSGWRFFNTYGWRLIQ